MVTLLCYQSVTEVTRGGRLQTLDNPVDALRQRADVVGLHRGEHADAQLVAAQAAVGLDVDDAVVDEFIEFLRWPSLRKQLETAQVPLDDETIDGAREDIRMYLQAHIAANIWGLQAGRIVLLRYDGQVQQSLGLMPQAADLMELKPQIAAGFWCYE
mgnify:CR=1 FL=1